MPRMRKSEARTLYDFATSGDQAKNARRFPKKTQEKLMAKLEGIRIPDERTEEFLKHFSKIAENVLETDPMLNSSVLLEEMERNDELLGKSMMKKNVEGLEKRFNELAELVGVAERSSDPVRYMKFLGRPGFRHHAFCSSVGIFVSDRKIFFEEVSEDNKKSREEIMRLANEGSDEALVELVGRLRRIVTDEVFEEHDAMAVAFCRDEEQAWRISEKFKNLKCFMEEDGFEVTLKISMGMAEAFLQKFGIYMIDGPQKFDRYFELNNGGLKGFILNDHKLFENMDAESISYVKDILLKNESEYDIQFQLQIVFDVLLNEGILDLDGFSDRLELRARLAAIAFSEEPQEAYFRFLLGEERKNDMLIRTMAMIDNYVDTHGRSKENLRKAAHKFLNNAYKARYGISYDAILEPFVGYE